ncbi:MAG: sugar ABC transporter permease [Clostridia bacterium]|nr:sugar ABC transporter permease [Clostridia bacterium]
MYALPALIFAVMFTYYPFLRTFYNSLFVVNIYGQATRFLGLANYRGVLANKNFLEALVNSLKYTAMGVPSSLLISLFLALMAERERSCSRVSEMLFSLPMAVSMSTTCMIFKLLLNPTVGYLNYALGIKVNWLHDVKTALPALVATSVWTNIGYQFIFLMAALRGIPTDLQEAASIEGAGWLARTRRITLPLITPTIFYLMCTDIVMNMMMAGPTMVLTRGNPRRSTVTLIYHMYDRSIYNQFWGYGYAMSVLIFLIIFGMILLAFRMERRGVHYA